MGNASSFQVVKFQRFHIHWRRRGFFCSHSSQHPFPNPKIAVFRITQPYTPFSSLFTRETLRIVVEASDFDPSIAKPKYRSVVGSFGSG
ncbi:hypothetical protein glysoja_000412 [Glycine soja]|nr:hypothetical protein glysoja_000412 [Glycine soja]